VANQETVETKNVRKKDTLFACSMLAVYVACCMTITTSSIIWAGDNEKNMHTNATATVIAHVTEQTQYKFIILIKGLIPRRSAACVKIVSSLSLR